MFCKFCGSHIDQKTMRCEKCGKEAGLLEGGIGFWDVANGKEKIPNRAASPMEGPKTDEKQIPAQKKRKSTVRAIVMMVMLAVSIFLGIASLVAINGLKERNEELANSVALLIRRTEMQEAEKSVMESSQTNPNDLASDETLTGSEPNVIAITKNPESDVLRTLEPRKLLFKLEASGEGLNFQWEKRSEETEEWEKVNEDQFDASVEQEEGLYIAKLALGDNLNGVDENKFYGVFRCVVSDSEGRQETSAEAYLRRESDSDLEK